MSLGKGCGEELFDVTQGSKGIANETPTHASRLDMSERNQHKPAVLDTLAGPLLQCLKKPDIDQGCLHSVSTQKCVRFAIAEDLC